MRAEFLETRKQDDLLAPADRGDRRASRKRRADDGAAQPPRVFEFRRVPLLRRARAVRQLRGDAHLPPPRPPPALPLLQLRRARARRTARSATASTSTSSGIGLGDAWRRNCTAQFPAARIARMDRDTVTGKRALRNHPARLPRGQLRHPGGHADDRQGARHSERDAGGRGVRRRRARHAGFPRRRAHLPVAHAGGRARRARQRAGRGARADHQSRPLRHTLRRGAGLRRSSTRRSCSSGA